MSGAPGLDCTPVGQGPAVFCLHAFPMDSRMWAPQIAFLRSTYTLYAPDLPGFGNSDRCPGWRIESAGRAVLELANQYRLTTFSVLGLSMGTYTAFEVYRQAPERVSALVLADGRARADSDAERKNRSQLISEVRRRGSRVLAEQVLPRLLGQNPVRGCAALVRAGLDASTVDALADALEALRERRDSTDLLGSIACPTLVIAGEQDAVTPQLECRQMAEQIGTARFVSIPRAGHLSNLENPVAFNQALEDFLISGGSGISGFD